MAGNISASGAGTGLSQARLQTGYQVRALRQTQTVVRDTGTAALKLIQTAVGPGTGQHLDVYA